MNRKDHFKLNCIDAGSVFEIKNEQYGDAIVETGVLGASVELIGAVARLRQLVLSPGDGGKHTDRKSLRNVFVDIHNYSNIALMMMEEDNWLGKDREISSSTSIMVPYWRGSNTWPKSIDEDNEDCTLETIAVFPHELYEKNGNIYYDLQSGHGVKTRLFVRKG